MLRKPALAIVILLAAMAAACSTSWIQTAEQYVAILTPAVEDVVGVLTLAGAAGSSSTVSSQVTNYANQATTDLQTISTLLTQYDSADASTTEQKITAAADDAKNNLNLILPALHITNASTVNKVTAALNLAVNTIAQLEALIPNSSASTTPTLAHLGKPPKPGDLQNQFNAIFAK